MTTLYRGDQIIRLFTDDIDMAHRYVPEEYEFIPYWEKPYYSNHFKVGIIGGDKLRNPREEAQRLIDLKRYFDIMFIETFEVHSYHERLFKIICDVPNIYYMMPGKTNYNMESRSINNNWFISTVTKIYKQLPFKLDELTPYIEKPYYFDALLGIQKHHRNFVYNNIMSYNKKNKFIVSYRSEVGSSSWLDDNDPNIDYCGDNFVVSKDSGLYSKYYGIDVWASQIIPITVFNNSAYSIIAETNYFNNFNFITEKTAKPLLAKRLFVVIAGQYFLRTLKEFGFKTFDGIIDESYDLEPTKGKRWQMAWDQIDWLCEQNQLEIYDKIKDITEHNFNIMMSTNFESKVFEEMLKLIS